MKILVKRVYDKPDSKDGFRILVDRLWPRGLSKDDAKIDVWLKAVAPSNELRKWYQHDIPKWPEFKKRYFAELDNNSEAVSELVNYLDKPTVMLLYGSKERQYNNAIALKEYIDSMLTQ
ncbi:DUF488 domain-containing protein [Sedimenticola selenatireducens]|uniref:DUF488 domain-containing protein n=1 Tax=Sedimenticola selenatireducens TaxID=191960 RepID=UPI00048D1A71|nr:DUF488 family protein [Sedimenticola selenatireducens]